MNAQKQILEIIVKNWLDSNLVILDTETTGLGPQAEIVEIAVIDMNGTVLLNSLVKPNRPVPKKITEINNITNEMLHDAPAFEHIYVNLMDLLSKHGKFIAWNAKFDARMIMQSAAAANLYNTVSANYIIKLFNDIRDHAVDAQHIYSIWYAQEAERGYRRQRLVHAAEQQNVTVDGTPHRALADCLTTLEVLRAMVGGNNGE